MSTGDQWGQSADAMVVWDALIRLVSGNRRFRPSADPVVFVESGAHLEFGLGLCEFPGSVVFSPRVDGAEVTRSPARVFTYEGGLAQAGAELAVAGGIVVHTQDYVTATSRPIAGSTIVRITGVRDYAAFLADADRARSEGVFAEPLLSRGVLLADQCALGTTHSCDYLVLIHVYVARSGEVRTAPGGAVLGTVESTLAEIETAVARLGDVGGDVCLNGVVVSTVLDEARAQRPWLSRYLRSIDLLRGLRHEDPSGYRVSGFGARLVGGLPAGLMESPDGPVLLWSDSQHLLCDTSTRRVFRLDADTARLVELLLVADSIEHASTLAAAHLRMDRAAARTALRVITRRLDDSDVWPTGVAP